MVLYFDACLPKIILKLVPSWFKNPFIFHCIVLSQTSRFFFFGGNLIPTLYFSMILGKIPSALKIFSHGEKAEQQPFPEAREFPSITSLFTTMRSSFFHLPGTAGSDSIMCCVGPDSTYFCLLFSYFCNSCLFHFPSAVIVGPA